MKKNSFSSSVDEIRNCLSFLFHCVGFAHTKLSIRECNDLQELTEACVLVRGISVGYFIEFLL